MTTPLLIRTILEEDAEAFLDLRAATDRETPFLLREPGEDCVPPEVMRRRIRATLARSNSTILLCSDRDGLVGYLQARGGDSIRDQGVIRFAMAILRAHWRRRIGTRLVQAIEEWAIGAGAYRLELLVSVDNRASIALFENLGYVVEGTKTRAAKIAGHFVDKLQMAKLL